MSGQRDPVASLMRAAEDAEAAARGLKQERLSIDQWYEIGALLARHAAFLLETAERLGQQLAGYREPHGIIDDLRQDPAERLRVAAEHLDRFRSALTLAVQAAGEYRYTVGHLASPERAGREPEPP